MGITSKEIKVGTCDACGKSKVADGTGMIPGFVGEVVDNNTGSVYEFFACSLPHVGKAVTKLVKGNPV